jgi:hypothetical protein
MKERNFSPGWIEDQTKFLNSYLRNRKEVYKTPVNRQKQEVGKKFTVKIQPHLWVFFLFLISLSSCISRDHFVIYDAVVVDKMIDVQHLESHRYYIPQFLVCLKPAGEERIYIRKTRSYQFWNSLKNGDTVGMMKKNSEWIFYKMDGDFIEDRLRSEEDIKNFIKYLKLKNVNYNEL